MDKDSRKDSNMYIDLLKASIKKKIEILNTILTITEQQEKLISINQLDDDSFDQTLIQKEKQINDLSQVDDGFNQIYLRVKDKLAEHKHEYKEDIEELQQLVKDMTDLGVMIEAMEKRNKIKIELYFTNKRKDLKTKRLNNQTVTKYYKSMTKLNDNRSFFYDKKN